MKNKAETLKAITDQGLLPLFFYEDADVSIEIVRTLYRAGVRVIEYTNRGPEALENFKRLVEVAEAEMPEMHVGIGTIKDIQQARDFIDAGAHFIVCPVVDLAIGQLTHDAGLLWVPGCFSPTEINQASRNGAGLIKLFPANLLGPAFMSSIKDLFPGQLFIPTGGVEIEATNINNWFKSGVCGVGMGSKLISKEILSDRDYVKLFELTKETLQIISDTRLS